MNYNDLVTMFVNNMRNANKSQITIEQYKDEVEYFLEFMKGKGIENIQNIKAIHIDLYQTHLIDKGNTTTTRSKKSSILKNFFKYLLKAELIEKNPTEKMEQIKIKDADKKKRETLTLKEAKKFIEKIYKNSIYKERNVAILMILLYCGLRKSELIQLKVDDLDLKNKVLYVWDGKGGKNRKVPLGDEAIRAIREYLKQRKNKSEYLFTRKKSVQPLSPRSVYALVDDHRKKAKIDKRIGVHGLRRTAATVNMLSGANIRNIQIWLGHSDISTTMRYLNPDEEEVMNDIRSKNLLDKELERARKAEEKKKKDEK